jgi:hypothetical protein
LPNEINLNKIYIKMLSDGSQFLLSNLQFGAQIGQGAQGAK